MKTIKDLQDEKKKLEQLLIDHKESITVIEFLSIINLIDQIDDIIQSTCN